MNILTRVSLSVLMMTVFTPAQADVHSFQAQLCNSDEAAKAWKSRDPGLGAAKISIDNDSKTLSLVLDVTGVAADLLAPAGPGGSFGSIHIHNYPQGGPHFFVQQLPGKITPLDDGFSFELEDWIMEPPKGATKEPVDFVLSEIVSGNAYLGLHTVRMMCADKKDGSTIKCAAPATALSGLIIPSGATGMSSCAS